MKVSVIIPIYNAAPYIAETLQSLQHQTMQDFEVLLVDDHGQDDSINVARQQIGADGRFRFFQTPVNSGPGIARNVGINAAKGEYIAFLDSDDFWETSFLEDLLNAAKQDSRTTDLTYCQLKYRGGKKDGQVHRNPVVEIGVFTPEAKKHFLKKFVTFSVCFLYRRDFLLKNQLFFTENRNSEDTNFLIRCLLLAETIACVDTPLYIYNVREDSLTTGRHPNRYKERLSALNAVINDFNHLKAEPRYSHLQLSQYNFIMWLLWLKKGLAQAILEVVR